MRNLLMLVALSCAVHLCAQDGNPPSKTEIQAQMKETISKAKKQREDVGKRIEEAKTNKQDASGIKQLEDRYAILDKMIAQLETADPYGNSRLNKSPVSKTIEPAFVSPFTPIMLKSQVIARADSLAKDRLLWFKGKKMDSNTLVARNGMLVRYDRKRQVLTVQPNKNNDSTYYCLVDALSRLSAGRKEFLTAVDSDPNSFFMFPSIAAAYGEFSAVRNQYYDLAKNSKDISPPQNHAGLETLLQQLMAYMNTLYPNPVIPQFPKSPNIFCNCDYEKDMEAFNKEFEKWKEAFDHEEVELAKLTAAISAQEDALIVNHAFSQIPANLAGTVNNAGIVLVRRLNAKLRSIRQQYESKHIDVEDGLTFAITDANICIRYYGASADDQLEIEINSLIKERDLAKKLIFSSLFKDVIEEKKANREFAEVLDYTRYVNHETNKELLDEHYKRNIQPWTKLIRDFNRFSLSIKMDFEYQNVAKKPEGDDVLMIATGTLESDKMTVSFGVEDCKLVFFIKAVNYKIRETDGEMFKIPMHVTGGTKDYTKDKNPPLPYTGPPTMRLLFPSFRLNFCGKRSDVKMEDMTYLASDLKQHEHDNLATQYSTDMFGYVNKMFVVVKQTQVNVSELIQSSIEGLNMNGSVGISRSTGDPVRDEMNERYEMDKKRRQLLYKAGNATQSARAIVDLGVIDPKGSATLIKKQIDLADPNDADRESGIVLRHGYLTIELLHTPQ